MINDPLLSSTHPLHEESSMTTHTAHTKKKTRRTPPARSAKILVVGLSTTAMLGMSTGYAFAGLAASTENTELPPTQPPLLTPEIPTEQSSADVASAISTRPVATPPAVVSQSDTVIEVPVPSGSATPGSGNSSWKKQKSSGSN
jgi:hypothetical protein